MSSPSRAISVSSDSDSDGHPADTLIVQKAQQKAAVAEAVEHRKKKRRRARDTPQPSSGAPSPARTGSPAQPDGAAGKKRKKAKSSSQPSSHSPQPEPAQEEAPHRKKRRKKRAPTDAAAKPQAGLQDPADGLERLARDAPDGAVLAAVDVSGSDSETDASVEIVGIGRSWAEAQPALAADTTGPRGATLPLPGSEISRLTGVTANNSAVKARAAANGTSVNGASLQRPAAPVGVTVVADDEAVTVNSELQRLLRVPRCEAAGDTVCTVA